MVQRKKETRDQDKIFAEDEMSLRAVDRSWTPEELVAKKGIFFLKDIIEILGLDPVKVKKHAREINRQHRNAWEVMGARKIWNHWIIRMVVFGPYYQEHLIPKVEPVSREWDGNSLLKQKGLFYLTEVCKLLPFSTHQIRYQAKKTPNSRERLGVWKHEELNSFVVDMERFAPWVTGLWQEFNRPRNPTKKPKRPKGNGKKL